MLAEIDRELEEVVADIERTKPHTYMPQQWYRDRLEILQDQVQDLQASHDKKWAVAIDAIAVLCSEEQDPAKVVEAKTIALKLVEENNVSVSN